MKTATVRQIHQELRTVLNWIEEGEQVQISKRGKIVALLTPPPGTKASRRRTRPDFAARLRRRDGDRVLAAGVMDDILDFNKGLH